MWLWLSARAKPHASREAIEDRRGAWISQGKERQLLARCRTAQRYVVNERDPAEVFWLLDTDDRRAADVISEHFGALWDIDVLAVTPQAIGLPSSS